MLRISVLVHGGEDQELEPLNRSRAGRSIRDVKKSINRGETMMIRKFGS